MFFIDWNFWDVVVGVIALLFAIYIFLSDRQRNRKRLEYFITGHRTTRSSRLEFFFDGKKVSNLHITIVDIRNVGALPISPEDFKEPITLIISEGTPILHVSKFSSKPENLSIDYVVDDGKILVTPLLLNKSDSFKTSLITAGYPNINVQGRIVGVSEIEELNRSNEYRRYVSSLFGLIILFVVHLLFVQYYSSGSRLVDGIPMVLIILVTLYLWRKFKKLEPPDL